MGMLTRTWKYFLAADEGHVLRRVAADTEKEAFSVLFVLWQSASWNPILYVLGKMLVKSIPSLISLLSAKVIATDKVTVGNKWTQDLH